VGPIASLVRVGRSLAQGRAARVHQGLIEAPSGKRPHAGFSTSAKSDRSRLVASKTMFYIWRLLCQPRCSLSTCSLSTAACQPPLGCQPLLRLTENGSGHRWVTPAAPTGSRFNIAQLLQRMGGGIRDGQVRQSRFRSGAHAPPPARRQKASDSGVRRVLLAAARPSMPRVRHPPELSRR
jgi:hypothetical protein